MDPNRLPDIVLPPPTKFSVAVSAAKALGVLLAGVAMVVVAFLVRDLYRQAHTNDDSARCRSELATDAANLQAEINATGWSAMLAAFRKDIPERDLLADHLEDLLEKVPTSLERRDKAFDICEGTDGGEAN